MRIIPLTGLLGGFNEMTFLTLLAQESSVLVPPLQKCPTSLQAMAEGTGWMSGSSFRASDLLGHHSL